MDLEGGLFWSCWPNNAVDFWAPTISQPELLYTTGSPRMEPWTDGEPMVLTSDRLRNPRLHSVRDRYVVKAASQCVCAYLDRSLAMCLLKPSSPIQCVFAMRLRLSNVSSQCVCATQCVFAMRLRYPMRLHNAPAPPNASAPSNASSECVCAC